MKKILCVILCLITVLTMLTSCGAPKIEEIRDRLSELIDASYGVNVLLFGEGPKTYERIYDPKADMQYYENGGQRYYYFYIEDDGKTVLAYRTKSYGDDYNYLLVTDTKQENCVYEDKDKGLYYVKTEYTPKNAEFYYDDSMPSDYDVVRLDEEYASVEKIKEYAETVYSKDYLESIYEMMFTGVMISDDVETGLLTARYIEYENTDGSRWFMKSNTYEAPMTEKRIFDVSSASIARGSKAKRVRVEMDSYLESKPDEVTKVIINLVLQDGEWFLDNGTY